MMRKYLLAAVLIGGACGVGAQARMPRNAVPAATPIGQPVNCVSLRSIRETRVHGDSVIDFHMTNKKVYRNTLPSSCSGLGFEERFLYKTSLSELCSVDVITVLHSGGGPQGPTCGLGQFQPVQLAPK